ncbi:hypothetical protein MFTT_06520 [Mycolicibacterium fortuitum subsp. fortuitum]|nr:hypothetical protein MFTT_06520 [Mycolicibacterium fortuitum subsp. fortuitum]CRL54791.1 hypothetical protein CPGR_02088 [Mycolicibacterium fortuitum subsp. fortuitum DSM 46621 = ATCC 6841 = JCM 6387]CRL79618.1 hypothetical protein CPGR_02813 [Mycolicibacter nonchromogenicus]
MRTPKRWDRPKANDPASLAARLPTELTSPDHWFTENGLYDVHAGVEGWLISQGADTKLSHEVMRLAGLDAAGWFKWWLAQPGVEPSAQRVPNS